VKIFFDARMVGGKPSGVRDIALGLIDGFRALESKGQVELVLVSADSLGGQADVILPSRGFMHFGLPLSAARHKADRIFIPRQTIPTVSTVATVPLFHDIGFLREPELYERNRVRDVTTRRAATAKMAVAVSNFTSKEIAEEGLSNSVTGLSVGAIHAVNWAPDHQAPYVLCVAAQEEHKNLVRLVKAWRIGRMGGMKLVICGRPGRDTPSLRQEIEQADDGSIVLVQDLNDEEYARLLSECWAYVQPSLYEGLCIPALDLAAAGVPLAVSNKGNIGEVFVDGGADVFDPESIEGIGEAIQRICGDQALREQLGESATHVVKATNWAKVAEEVLGAME